MLKRALGRFFRKYLMVTLRDNTIFEILAAIVLLKIIPHIF